MTPDQQLDELRALSRSTHPHYLSVSFTEREIQFLADLVKLRRDAGRLYLTRRQAAWLRNIHERMIEDIRFAETYRPPQRAEVNRK